MKCGHGGLVLRNELRKSQCAAAEAPLQLLSVTDDRGPMTSWFDSLAKRSARSADESHGETSSGGLTRRQALLGGALATGVAWTAPALLATQPAWAVASCTGDAPRCTFNTVDGLPNGCCPGPVGGIQYTCPVDTRTCTAPGAVGGNCTNGGQGVSGCSNANSSSIACNGVKDNNICGGVGARCNSPADCASSAPFCKGSTKTDKVCSVTGPSGP